MSDSSCLPFVLNSCRTILPDLVIRGGASEPFYQASKHNQPAILFFRQDFVRSLFHELAHYCLAGNKRRMFDDFGYWYQPCGRSGKEQILFELVEARPQGLEKVFCELWQVPFTPSLDNFSERPTSKIFLENLENAYIEMTTSPPVTAKYLLEGMHHFVEVESNTVNVSGSRMWE